MLYLCPSPGAGGPACRLQRRYTHAPAAAQLTNRIARFARSYAIFWLNSVFYSARRTLCLRSPIRSQCAISVIMSPLPKVTLPKCDTAWRKSPASPRRDPHLQANRGWTKRRRRTQGERAATGRSRLRREDRRCAKLARGITTRMWEGSLLCCASAQAELKDAPLLSYQPN